MDYSASLKQTIFTWASSILLAFYSFPLLWFHCYCCLRELCYSPQRLCTRNEANQTLRADRPHSLQAVTEVLSRKAFSQIRVWFSLTSPLLLCKRLPYCFGKAMAWLKTIANAALTSVKQRDALIREDGTTWKQQAGRSTGNRHLSEQEFLRTDIPVWCKAGTERKQSCN